MRSYRERRTLRPALDQTIESTTHVLHSRVHGLRCATHSRLSSTNGTCRTEGLPTEGELTDAGAIGRVGIRGTETDGVYCNSMSCALFLNHWYDPCKASCLTPVINVALSRLTRASCIVHRHQCLSERSYRDTQCRICLSCSVPVALEAECLTPCRVASCSSPVGESGLRIAVARAQNRVLMVGGVR